MDTQELMKVWRKTMRIASDAEAARRLGVSRGSVGNWKSGYSRPEPQYVEQMAREAGLEWRVIVLESLAEQQEKNAALAKTLRRIAQTLAICLVAVIGTITSNPALSNSARSNLTESGQAIHYAHRFRGWLRRLTHAFARVKLSDVAA